MTERNTPTNPTIHSAPVGKRMLIGAGIALTLITIFILNAGEPNPEWPKLWWIRPIIVVTFAGAMGGLVFHLMDHLRSRGSWQKIVANILSVIIYIFGLWIGTVLGLVGTMWD